MKSWKALVAAIAVVSQISAVPAAQAQQNGWALYQVSPHMGTLYVYVSSGGLAAVFKKMGATMVTSSPRWDVILYNDKTKVYFLSTLAEWKGTIQQQGKSKKYAAAKRTVEAPPRKGKTAIIAGMHATQFITDNSLPGSGGPKRAEFWMTTDINVPPQLTQLLVKTYGIGLSTVKGMPLRVAYIDETGKKNTIVDTLKCQKQMIPTQSFKYPPTYTRVDNEVAVFMDEKSRKTMASIMDDLGSDGSDDLNSLLGDTKSGSSTYKSSYNGSRTYQPRPTVTATRPAPVATPAKPAQNDWWNNIFNAFGGKK